MSEKELESRDIDAIIALARKGLEAERIEQETSQDRGEE